ncbi:MAG TPA: hypothetical protein PK156_39985, partial [Polyangium sp.]|nr:hypothetical protein [Polyangium sp.]
MAEAIDHDKQPTRVALNDQLGVSADGFPFGRELSGAYIHGLLGVFPDADGCSEAGMSIEFELVHQAFGSPQACSHAPFRAIRAAQDECWVRDAWALITRHDLDAATFSFNAT